MELRDVKGQPWTTLILDYYVCHYCAVVDRKGDRLAVETPCPECGKPSERAYQYFPLTIDTLVDLLQEAFHFQSTATSTGRPLAQVTKDQQLSIIIFFASIGDALLTFFLKEVSRALILPDSVTTRLLHDNLFMRQRVEKVFPALTGDSWKGALTQLGATESTDYLTIAKFFLSVVDKRNLLLHEGLKWAIPSTMPEECIEHLAPLIRLFVGLHNRYVRPRYDKDQRPYLTVV